MAEKTHTCPTCPMCPICREITPGPGYLLNCCNNKICASCKDDTFEFMQQNGCPLCRSTFDSFCITVDFTETIERGLLPLITVKRNGQLETVIISERTMRAIGRTINKAHHDMLPLCRSGKACVPFLLNNKILLYLQPGQIEALRRVRTSAMQQITDYMLNFLKTYSESSPSGSLMKLFLAPAHKTLCFTGGIDFLLEPSNSFAVRRHFFLQVYGAKYLYGVKDEFLRYSQEFIEVRDEMWELWDLWVMQDVKTVQLCDTYPEETGMIFARNLMQCERNCSALATPYGRFVASHWRMCMFPATGDEETVDWCGLLSEIAESECRFSRWFSLREKCFKMINERWENITWDPSTPSTPSTT